MGKSVMNPKKYIVSCRINDDEMETLQELAKKSNTSISTLLRYSLNLLESQMGLSTSNA